MKIGRGCAAVTGTKSESHCPAEVPPWADEGGWEGQRVDISRKSENIAFHTHRIDAKRRYDSFADEEGEDWIFSLRSLVRRGGLIYSSCGKNEGFFVSTAI